MQPVSVRETLNGEALIDKGIECREKPWSCAASIG